MPSACTSANPVVGRRQLAVGGITPLTTIDYPGCLSAVIFCQGCPWQCHYCHNPHLIERHAGEVPWTEVENFLHQRRGLLDAVVFSGGEPTLQRQLPEAMTLAKSLGYKVGLHTSGAAPRQALRCLPHVDWVGLDIKQLPDKYASITSRTDSYRGPYQLLETLVQQTIDHEVRITLHPSWLSVDDLDSLLNYLHRENAPNVILQRGNPPGGSAVPPSHTWQVYDSIIHRHASQFSTLRWRD